MKNLAKRILESNNRELGILFGCIIGAILGVIVMTQHDGAIPIVGNPVSLPYQIIAILIAAGTGGNLTSYIGAGIDILTAEKTIFDLIKYYYYKKQIEG